MKIFNNTFLLRLAVAIILFMHSMPGMFNNGVNAFGNLYLDQIGFAPFGIFLAWTIKLSHLVAALCLLFEKYVKIDIFRYNFGIDNRYYFNPLQRRVVCCRRWKKWCRI